jgi:hypothetical protein
MNGQLKVRGNEITISVDEADTVKSIPDMQVELSYDGTTLHVSPASRTANDEEFRVAFEHVKKKYHKTFERLAK